MTNRCLIYILTVLELFIIACQGNVNPPDQNQNTDNLFGTFTKKVSFHYDDGSLFGGILDIDIEKTKGGDKSFYVDIRPLGTCYKCIEDGVEKRIYSNDGKAIRVRGWEPLNLSLDYELRVSIEGWDILDAWKYDMSFNITCRNCFKQHCPQYSERHCPQGQECIDDVCQDACGDPCFPGAMCYGDENRNKEYSEKIDDGTAHDDGTLIGQLRRCSSECKDISAWLGTPEGGAVRCNGDCVNTLFNNNHCGFCGNVCPQNFVCAYGKCVDCNATTDCDKDEFHQVCNGIHRFQNPTTPEICGNGIDDDCDQKTDDETCTYFCLRDWWSLEDTKPKDCPKDMFCKQEVCRHQDCAGSCEDSNSVCNSGKCECKFFSCGIGADRICCAPGEVCTSNQTCGTETACIEPGHPCGPEGCCSLDTEATCDPGFNYCCWKNAGHSCTSSLECCGSMLCSSGTDRTCYQP